jgi:outer membrane receptor protein involved in Fe transport
MKQARVYRCLSVVGMLCTAGAAAAQSGRVVDTRGVSNEARVSAEVFARSVSLSLEGIDLTTAVRTLCRNAQVRVQFPADVLEAIRRPVTLHMTNVPLGIAFDRLFKGTSLHAVILSRDAVEIVRGSDAAHLLQGVVRGTVIDATTKRPLRGVKIELAGVTRAETAADGTYRLAGMPTGTHSLTMKLLGYGRVSRTVTVQDDATVVVDAVLQPSTNTLDQVVVTGTVIPTERKAVPNAMTVITAQQIEERGITQIQQLFRGDVPGLFAQNQGSSPLALLDQVTMFSRGVTSLHNMNPQTYATTFFTNPIKTYIDGVELADSRYLSQIDPKSIERIEILTGPQASTIYGSNAINGVMQIFTKRGATSKPQLTLNLLSGWVENNFRSTRTPQHDHSAQLSGIEGRLSYNVGGSWNYMGPWTPSKQTTRTGGFGGIRAEFPTRAGSVTTDFTLRRSMTENRQRGDIGQTTTRYRETGWYGQDAFTAMGVAKPTTNALSGQTLGIVLGYAPASWWSHEFELGRDGSDTEERHTARGYRYGGDTALYFWQSSTERRSLRYATTARIHVATLAQLTMTAGADAWQNLASSSVSQSQALTGTMAYSSISRQPDHNAGGFLQTQLGVKDKLFVTYGLRAEWNPGFGEEEQPNFAPRYGVAYTEEFGHVTAKLRGTYGRSTRPPNSKLKTSQRVTEIGYLSYLVPLYGEFEHYFANPELGPEYQQGGEGGMELYFGTRASLVITRYNQTVDRLIANPKVDSVRSLAINPWEYNRKDPNGYGYYYQLQNLNVGTIRNQGWELQGSVNTGPITTRGTYSWTKSRTIGIDPKYRAQFSPSSYPQYQPGATFDYLPEHTWALGMTYVRAATTVGLNVMGTGSMRKESDAFAGRNLSGAIRLPQNRMIWDIGYPSRYVNFNNGYAVTDLTASHRISSRMEGVLRVQNLTNRYVNDYNDGYASMGRQTRLGFILRP